MSNPQIRIRGLGPVPAKPPMESFQADLELSNPAGRDLWFVLPLWIDQPLVSRLANAGRIECLQQADGAVYCQVYAEPPAVFIPVAAGAAVTLHDWTFSSWSEAREGESWIVETAAVPGWGDLRDKMAAGGPLAPPSPRPQGAALLAEVELPAGSAVEITPLFRHTLPLAG